MNETTASLTVIATHDILIAPDSPMNMVLNGVFVAVNGAFGRNNYFSNIGCTGLYEPRGTLTVSGTIDDPSIAGRVSIEGGTIKLRSQRYEITTGTLDFPVGGATPFANILTEGDVSGYHVYLGLEGPIDAMDVTLRSDPELPRSEILSLVATGKTDSNGRPRLSP